MRPCPECGMTRRCHSQCPNFYEYEGPELPEADEDERGGEYEDDEPVTIDCWKQLDEVGAAWEGKHHG